MQIILVAFGVGLAVGGGLLLVKSIGRDDDARKGYVPLAMIVVGLVIAYRSYSSFRTLDTQDITIMFLFALGLFGLLGLQFFVIEKNSRYFDASGEEVARAGDEEER